MMAKNVSEVYREVMTVEPPKSMTPGEEARYRYLFGELWIRPGLGRQERRWVTLVCVGFDTDQEAMDDQVYAALNSGDISLNEILEFILHFAVVLRVAEGVAHGGGGARAVGAPPARTWTGGDRVAEPGQRQPRTERLGTAIATGRRRNSGT